MVKKLFTYLLLLIITTMHHQSFALPPLPDQITLGGGYNLILHTNIKHTVNSGYTINFDYGHPITSVEHSYASYLTVPITYTHYPSGMHYIRLGGGFRHWFSRVDQWSPFVSYQLTLDQLYTSGLHFGVGNQLKAGINIKTGDIITFIHSNYHYAYFPHRLRNASPKDLHQLRILAGIRLQIAGCDCPH